MADQFTSLVSEMYRNVHHLQEQIEYRRMIQDPLAGQRGELPSALELPKTLGCDDDKRENYLEIWKDESKLEAIPKLVNMGLAGRPGSAKLFNEFCCNYLPCFMRALRKCADRSREMYLNIVMNSLVSPQFHRYLRTHPEAKGFLGWLGTMFAKEVPTYLEMTEGSVQNGPPVSSCNRLLIFDLITWQTILHVGLQPETMVDLDIPAAAKIQLVKKLRPLQDEEFMKRGRRTFPDPQLEHSLLRAVQMSYPISEWLDGKLTVQEIVKKEVETGRTLPWVHCALKGRGGCKTLGQGVEMQACSRCKAVRYCSPEHQKADWKAHKPMCLPPTWGPSYA